MPGSTEGLASVFEEDPSVGANVYEKTPREQGRTTGAQYQDVAEEKKQEQPPPPPPESAYEQLANAQADQYLADTKSINNLTADYTSPNTQAGVNANAESMVGVSSTSPISQWLNQQTQAAAGQNAPMVAAESQLTGAENQAAKMEAGGLREMGQAETAMMQAAPYQQLLQSLASEVPYHLASGYSFPSLVGTNVPAFLQKAETDVGVNTTGQGTGVSGIPTLGSPTSAAQGVVAPTSSTNPTPTTYP